MAFVQLLPGAKTSADELKSYSAALLTSYKRPSEILVSRRAAGGVDRQDPEAQAAGIANESKIDPQAAG